MNDHLHFIDRLLMLKLVAIIDVVSLLFIVNVECLYNNFSGGAAIIWMFEEYFIYDNKQPYRLYIEFDIYCQYLLDIVDDN